MKDFSWLIAGIALGGGLFLNACSDSNDDDGASAGTGGAAGSGTSGGSGGSAAGSGGSAGTPLAPSCEEIPSLAVGDQAFTVTSTAFAHCMSIPAAHTCDQKPFPQGASPALTWTAGPTGTQSYAIVFKDLSVLARTAATDPAYNRGYHYVIWDIPASVTNLPGAMAGGHSSTDVPGARQWSNFNDYGYFGPCPNFDPAMPTNFEDSYAFVVYALPTAAAPVPAPQMGLSTVRLLDDSFKAIALAVAEVRGTSSAHSSGIPDGILPPMPSPPCPTEGTPPAGCLSGP